MDVTKARIFASELDTATRTQFEACIAKDFVVDAALMPDAHFGYVAPIGSVIVTKKVIVPAWVGYDIGCGVTAIKLTGKDTLKKITQKQEELFTLVRKKVPMGLGKVNTENNVSRESKIKLRELLAHLQTQPHNKEIFSFITRKSLSTLGSIGHGNHFAEISTDGKNAWLIIHSGSRNIGHKVATHYMQIAQKASGETNTTSFEATYALATTTALGKEYQAVLDFLLEYALLNRIEIGKQICTCIEEVLATKVTTVIWANKNHNHVVAFGKKGVFIHRKGATPSEKKERGIIPANMRDGSFLVEGKGNKEFLCSSSHGAGRRVSKRTAKETISLEAFKKTMHGITASVENATIDESPFAYKDVTNVLAAQKKSIRVLKQLKPIINWKGF